MTHKIVILALALVSLGAAVTYPKETVPAQTLHPDAVSCLMALVPAFTSEPPEAFVSVRLWDDPHNGGRTCIQSHIEKSTDVETYVTTLLDSVPVDRYADNGATVYYRKTLETECLPSTLFVPITACMASLGAIPGAEVQSAYFARADTQPTTPITTAPYVQTVTADPLTYGNDAAKGKARAPIKVTR